MSKLQKNYQEQELMTFSGWLLVLFETILISGVVFLFYSSKPSFILLGILMFFIVIIINGFVIINPNEALISTFFGNYVGTKKDTGFYWINPLNKKEKISTKIHNLMTQQLKVNDKNGNPIEIAAVFVWRVSDTAKASFAVENYALFLKNQCESALRKLATQYTYDGDEEITFKNNTDDISQNLKETLTHFIAFSGIVIEDARLTHLAYSPEIAQVMLRKQQAEAVVAARKKIVEGEINMVEEVLQEMEKRNLATFQENDKIKLINNLMTVLVSESETKPVVQLEK